MGAYGEYSSLLRNFGGFKLVTNLKETIEASVNLVDHNDADDATGKRPPRPFCLLMQSRQKRMQVLQKYLRLTVLQGKINMRNAASDQRQILKTNREHENDFSLPDKQADLSICTCQVSSA